ncbi:TetR family transcriptional regulator [Methylobacterium sp. Leaf399]|uniref:ABA4-like family protein n=1 Tax=unclassified Methylobacterium TaxID=2615210 RepID=UPI0006F76BDA|nr:MULTISPECIES: ABA4-like family protein [unclassified Methylobacterium]KQT17176.1 TetR family transcriptional regulator [Methylobacterium sp. Leaf399]KQT77712.1 TetR family transcriptional regulator [Methylobacterium sp. Leaf466]
MIAAPALFSLANAVALAAWIALGLSLFAPRWRPWTFLVTGLVLPGLFGIAYGGALAAGLAGGAGGGFSSIQDVRALFANDHALTAGWIHYLAFDLVVGTWIARSGLAAGLSPLLILPCLVLTFLVGPLGLLLALVIRAGTGTLGAEARP